MLKTQYVAFGALMLLAGIGIGKFMVGGTWAVAIVTGVIMGALSAVLLRVLKG
ncbi:hypothetical protein [Micromonospora marina]|uniref:Uncharacterized protein n=1 Tax=Micromonospora marina TaxID=307120 RepID=A0A1C5AM43_9ACTN|nr:hypothetical protein [Micromonospora marina]SCF46267.1 hypothetical protein GA0070215_14314 [Micromonospora marina]